MVRAVILYEREPDAQRYERHLTEFVNEVESAAFRHGKAFGSPFGEPSFAYYAEWEWRDTDEFEAATRSAEFRATGKDALEMGIPFTVTFVGLD